MLNLLKNEWIKVARKRSNQVLLLITVLIIGGISFMAQYVMRNLEMNVNRKYVKDLHTDTVDRAAKRAETFLETAEEQGPSIAYMKLKGYYTSFKENGGDPEAYYEEGVLEQEKYLLARELGVAGEVFFLDREIFRGVIITWKARAITEAYNQKAGHEEWYVNLLRIAKGEDPGAFYRYMAEVVYAPREGESTEAAAYRRYYKAFADHQIYEISGEEKEVQFEEMNRELLELELNEENDISGGMAAKEKIEKEKLLLAYRIEHEQYHCLYVRQMDEGYDMLEQNLTCTSDAWGSLLLTFPYITFPAFFLFVVAAHIFAGEVKQRTIKTLLIHPVTRKKIYWSKMGIVGLLVLGYGLLFLGIHTLIMALMGTEGFGASYLMIRGNTITAVPAVLFMLGLFLAKLVPLCVFVVLTASMSASSGNMASPVIVSFIAMQAVSIVNEIINSYFTDILFFLVSANLDFWNIYQGNGYLPNQTLLDAMLVVGFHLFIMLWAGSYAFRHKDVTA